MHQERNEVGWVLRIQVKVVRVNELENVGEVSLGDACDLDHPLSLLLVPVFRAEHRSEVITPRAKNC